MKIFHIFVFIDFTSLLPFVEALSISARKARSSFFCAVTLTLLFEFDPTLASCSTLPSAVEVLASTSSSEDSDDDDDDEQGADEKTILCSLEERGSTSEFQSSVSEEQDSVSEIQEPTSEEQNPISKEQEIISKIECVSTDFSLLNKPEVPLNNNGLLRIS